MTQRLSRLHSPSEAHGNRFAASLELQPSGDLSKVRIRTLDCLGRTAFR
jgi:hypothetical protein